MKLFAATLAVASAQDFVSSEAGDDARTFSFGDSAFDYGDSYSGFQGGAFYDSAYGSDYGSLAAAYNYDDVNAAPADADAAVADDAGRDKDEARYFGVTEVTEPTTTTKTFTTTPMKKTYCLKCDVMEAAKCAIDAADIEVEACEADDVCFLEVRRSFTRAPSGGVLTQICTGCKHKQACMDLKNQNSITGKTRFYDLEQCHPMSANFKNPRLTDMASVCRTCFLPSDMTKDDIDDDVTGVEYAHKFLVGSAGDDDEDASDDFLTIPDGTDASEPVLFYGNNDADFYDNWFRLRHGIPHLSSYDLDFSMDSPVEE